MTAASKQPIDFGAAPATPKHPGEPAAPFLELVRGAGLAELPEGATVADVAPCLDALAKLASGADTCTLALVRAEATRLVKGTGIAGAARLVDAHLSRVGRGGSDDAKQGGAVLFPPSNPWPEPVETAKLLAELARTVVRFVVLPPGAATAIALWILHTHAIDAAQITPRLAILSPLKRCGKSTLLKLLAALVRRPLPTANLTAAALFRIVEAHAPTLLVDEADTFLPDNEELRGVLNAGHDRQSAAIVRCVGDEHEPRTFGVWAPVAIAAIGKLPDTLMDRSIALSMKRKSKGESAERFRRRERGALLDLRRRCERWAVDVAPTLADAKPAVPDELNDRAADNWEPLLAIADAAGQSWGERARRAAIVMVGAQGDEDTATQAETLLADIHAVFSDRAVDRLASKALLDELTKLDGRPWVEANRGRALTSSGLAKLLRRFEIRSGTIRLADGSTPKGYMREAFVEAWTRYLPAGNATAATRAKANVNPAEPRAPQERVVAATAAGDSANDSGHVAAVAAAQGVGGPDEDDVEREAIQAEEARTRRAPG